MSDVAYNLGRQWDIPAYVWPAVLGISVAAHVSLFVFGLPIEPWTATEPDIPPETEVIIESGGPVFKDVSLLEPASLAPDVSEATEIVEPLTPQTETLVENDVSNVQPLESVPVQPTLIPAEEIASEQVSDLVEAETVEAVLLQAPDVDSLPVEEVTPDPVPSADSQLLEALEIVEPEPAAIPEVALEDNTSQPLLSAVETAIPLSAETPQVTPLQGQEVEVPPEQAPVVTETLVLTESPDTTTVTVFPEAAPDTSIVPVISGTEITPVAPIGTPDNVISEPDIAISTGFETRVEDILDAGSQQTSVVPLSPAEVVTTVTQEDGTAGSVSPGNPIVVAPLENPVLDPIAPVAQQLSAVEPEETVVAALSPSEPETSVLPSIDPQPDPADVVPPVEVATIDPLAKVTSYVRDYDFGECAHLSVLSAGADSAAVTAFGSGIGPFALFDQRFKNDQGYEASIELRLVTQQQCALLNALGVSNGLEAAGLVELDRTVVKSGTLATGVIQRDLPVTRIAAAEANGVDLSGRGPPELYLIDDAGQIHDGREFLLPASNAQTAGGWRFKVPVVLMSASEAETALVLAVWNRPPASQPPRFGTLPAARIAGILAAPGVYSLAAFKVSR